MGCVVCLKITFCKNYSAESWEIGIESHRQSLQNHVAPRKNSGTKKSKKSGGKGSVLLVKNSKHLGCVFQDNEPTKSKSMLRKSTQPLESERTVCFQQSTLHSVKIQGVHREESFRSVNLKSAALVHQSSRMEHRKKPCSKNDAPTEDYGIWRNTSTSSTTEMKPRSSRLPKFGQCQHHLRSGPGREDSSSTSSIPASLRSDEQASGHRHDPSKNPKQQLLGQPRSSGKPLARRPRVAGVHKYS